MSIPTSMKAQPNNKNFRFVVDTHKVKMLNPKPDRVYEIDVRGYWEDGKFVSLGETDIKD